MPEENQRKKAKSNLTWDIFSQIALFLPMILSWVIMWNMFDDALFFIEDRYKIKGIWLFLFRLVLVTLSISIFFTKWAEDINARLVKESDDQSVTPVRYWWGL